MKKLNFALTICLALALGSLLRGSDTFQGNYTAMTFPGYQCAAISSFSDTNDLATTARAIYVGTGGDLSIELQNDTPGTATVFKNIPSGTMLDLRVRRVRTATTAADLVEIW